MTGFVGRLTAGLCLAACALPAAAQAQSSDVWEPVPGTTPAALGGARADIKPERFSAFSLDQAGLEADLAQAPRGSAGARAGGSSILTVPGPDGRLQRFAIRESSIMEPKLAALHPEISTYAGEGIDDPTATIAADVGPLGFHASVRAATGAWYVDPYYHLDDSVYVSYLGRDLVEDPHGSFVERGPLGESDPLHLGAAAAAAGPEIKLRTYRLALVTDPTYSTYFGGPANVTAAKVTLMNRVNQIYETESAIRMVLIGDNDKLNLDTAALMTGANGPCGSAACFTQTQATECAGATLNRNRIVIGQIIGAGNYDVGHIALGNPGGGVASLGVIGGNNKAQGCTGLPTPVGDYFAVDYVAHEIGHQFAGNHTFNGTQSNCGGNRSGANSVEPGSGSSIMAYAGICQQDNLQPHSDPYWAPRSHEEIQALVTIPRPPINEVQTISLRDFGAGDSLRLGLFGQQTAPITSGVNYTLAGIQQALQGPSEVQTVALAGYDTNGDSYRLSYGGVNTVPIVRGQNNTAAGIANAVVGGNEQQQVTLASFAAATQSFRIQINGVNSVVLGQGGLAVTNANVATAVNGIAGFAGTVTSAGAGNTGFTLTFAGASAGVDVPPVSIVNCTGTCTSTVRENAKGGAALSSWPAGATVAVGTVTDAGYTLTISGTGQGTDFAPFSIADAVGATGAVTETVKGAPGMLPPGATGVVAAFGGTGNLTADGFQVTFGGTLGLIDVAPLALEVTGGSGFVGETARGGPIQNLGYTITDTGNFAPDVVAPASFVIPPRTPFALTGSATDPNGDALTYMWEQNDRAGIQADNNTLGTALVSNTKTNGPIFRQFGTAADIPLADAIKYHSPGLNLTDNNPTRVFPDMAQILANNTNAATGTCPTAPPAPQTVPAAIRDCFSEWLPTAAWVGFLSDRTITFRLTARDGKMGGGGVANAETKITVAQFAGPFRVTSHAVPQIVYGTSLQTVTWDVAGTDLTPINVANVKISVITETGATYVVAASTPNDGSAQVNWPDVAATKARVKVEAVGNVFFDVSDTDVTSVVAPTGSAGGTVAATLSLTLGAPANFGAFTPGVLRDYLAGSTANVISTAGDAALSVADPSPIATGHLVNGAFSLPSALQARAGTTAAYSTVSGAPATLKTYDGPVSNDVVDIGFRQHIDATDALRTGTYGKTLTFTLSTTTP